MTARRAARTTIGAALRRKFKSPREALLKLGIDERLLSEPGLAYDGANKMPTKPNRLQYLLVTRAARIFNPQLTFDAKVEYGPLFKGITTKNLKAKKQSIIGDAKKLLKGKTMAKDASIDGLAALLDKLEHPPNQAQLDESVSPEQHNAMEAAAHGHSNLGIPKSVGQEFERADKGKSFDMKGFPDFLRSKGATDDGLTSIMDAIRDNLPENALDEGEEVEVEVEQAEGDAAENIEQEEAEEGDDAAIEQEEGEEGEDARRAAKDKAARDKAAKDKRAAKDRRGAMDAKKFVTQDEANKAIEAAVKKERENNAKAMDARAFVRPHVGELSMALDSEEKILRAAAEGMDIDDADKVHVSALRGMITMKAKLNRRAASGDDDRGMAHDSAGAKGFAERFPGAARIGTA